MKWSLLAPTGEILMTGASDRVLDVSSFKDENGVLFGDTSINPACTLVYDGAMGYEGVIPDEVAISSHYFDSTSKQFVQIPPSEKLRKFSYETKQWEDDSDLILKTKQDMLAMAKAKAKALVAAPIRVSGVLIDADSLMLDDTTEEFVDLESGGVVTLNVQEVVDAYTTRRMEVKAAVLEKTSQIVSAASREDLLLVDDETS